MLNKNIKNLLFFLLMPTISLPQVITLFSHGIADTKKQAYWYAKTYQKKGIRYFNERYLFNTPFVTFNYPDATTGRHRVNAAETSFGQENEIDRLHLAYDWIINNHEDSDIILWGLSRGASNVSIFAGLYEYDAIKALVLESPYYTMTEVIENMMRKFNLSFIPVAYGEYIAQLIFKKYKPNGCSPANCIETIPLDMPILIICSKEDSLVPCSSSINMYKKLVNSGHKHTYIFITDFGKHAKILQGIDGEKYQAVVNAFYKKYNLPYCAASAAQGEDLFLQCQPIF